ncbi:hypothetical protein M3612_19920 [Niallia taxi]|uniref:hypothetical protein n=1 Tax=Niallia taxi TaxID=2499688 RepID=UPI00203C21E7|nr:hypothetical protein [Niallia taxi]MCM3216756.1 hypothetical protein [Niallia taxi]
MDFYEPGKTISFRLPQNTPKAVIEHLNQRKVTLGRNFSREIAPLFVNAIDDSLKNSQMETVNIPLPSGLTKDQLDWINSSYTKSLLSQLIYQVINKPGTPSALGESVPAIDSKENDEVQPKTNPFKINSTTSSFVQKTFLNFDDDDDDD